MTRIRTIFILIALFSLKQLYSQTTTTLKSVDTSDYKSRRQEINQILVIKKQYPDSFVTEGLYSRLVMDYFYIADTINFIRSTNEILAMNTKPDKDGYSDDYLKSRLTRHLFYIYQAKHDTLNLIDISEKRLFIFNTVSCGTGEKEFRLKLFDIIINYYSAKEQVDKVQELKTMRQKYVNKNKLSKPHYL